jgi:hypothetical protein
MLFIDERVAGLAAIPPEELPPLCAIASVPGSAKTIASVMIETFIVIFLFRVAERVKSRRTIYVVVGTSTNRDQSI